LVSEWVSKQQLKKEIMKKGIVILIISSLMLGSCAKFLDEQPYSILSNTNFYKSEGDAEAGLNGVFGTMQPQAYYGRTVWLTCDLTGEALAVGANASSDRIQLNTYTYNGSNGEILNWWKNAYLMINRANDVIVNVPNISMDTLKRNNIEGNARFLRAMAYFELLRSFGEVPLTVTPTTASSDAQPPKAPLAAIYQQVIDDLTYAQRFCFTENNIPTSLKGRVSSGAATTLLAKVYLTRAKSTAAEPSDNANALVACNKVISSNIYKLVPVYGDVFLPEKRNGPEHIFSVQFDLPPSVGNIIIRLMYPTQTYPSGAASFIATTTFGDTYIAADSIRKNWNLSTRAVSKAGVVTTVPLYYVKYKDALWTTQSNNSRTNWIITRYADVLLMQSEAMNNINPSDAGKFDGINAVRARAGLTSPTQQLSFDNTPTSDDFVTALVNERGWELCLEGHRRWDLIRLGRLQEYMAKKGVIVTSNDPLFPIPDSEIALNPNLK
jgi:hypothetical protein